jgi:peptidoglycan/LPS O-acetylase OafA/YrhL
MARDASVAKAVVFAAVVYAILFAAHIVAAANDWTWLFRVIATSLTCMTFLLGGCLAWMLKNENLEMRKRGHSIGAWISIPLAIGLAYAYAEQSFDITLSAAFVALTLMSHALTERRLS